MVCDVGYSRLQQSGQCEPCSANVAGSVVLAIVIMVVILGALYLFLLYSRRSNAGYTRPFINMCQSLQVLLSFNVKWPDSFLYLQSVLGGIVSFDAVSLTSPSCMGVPINYHTKFGLMVGGMFSLIVLPWLTLLPYVNGRHRDDDGDTVGDTDDDDENNGRNQRGRRK